MKYKPCPRCGMPTQGVQSSDKLSYSVLCEDCWDDDAQEVKARQDMLQRQMEDDQG